jgi:hypothetical protein
MPKADQEMTNYSRGLENLRRHIRLAKQALISDEAYVAALQEERDRDFWARVDYVSRAIAALAGIKLNRTERCGLKRWTGSAQFRSSKGLADRLCSSLSLRVRWHRVVPEGKAPCST